MILVTTERCTWTLWICCPPREIRGLSAVRLSWPKSLQGWFLANAIPRCCSGYLDGIIGTGPRVGSIGGGVDDGGVDDGGVNSREGAFGGRILVKIWTWMRLGAQVLLRPLVCLGGGGQEDDGGVAVRWVKVQRCLRVRQPSSADDGLACRIHRSFCLVFLPRWRWWIGQRDIRPRPGLGGEWPLLRAAVLRGLRPLRAKTPVVILIKWRKVSGLKMV